MAIYVLTAPWPMAAVLSLHAREIVLLRLLRRRTYLCRAMVPGIRGMSSPNLKRVGRELLFVACALLFVATPPCALAAEMTRAEIEHKVAAAHGAPIDLSNLDLSGVDVSGLNLHGADFFSTKLTGAKLAKADLSDANFTRADLQNADFSGAQMKAATLYAALLDGAIFDHADLSNARVIGGGKGVNFHDAKLIGADLGADPANQGMVPVRAELPDANFDGADLTSANLTHAVLTGATFTGAVVTGARFDYAVLDGSNLSLGR
jgi:uncharacterized protein YjbI with pentapeptide repeats